MEENRKVAGTFETMGRGEGESFLKWAGRNLTKFQAEKGRRTDELFGKDSPDFGEGFRYGLASARELLRKLDKHEV